VAINTQKVVVGGLAGGVVMAVYDYVVNGVILAAQNEAAMNALNPGLAANLEGATAMVTFVCIDLLFGILLVWTYAMVRPRFGPGPRTAMIAGLQVWIVALLLNVAMTAMGMWSWRYLFMSAVFSLFGLLIATYVGALLYKEE